MLTEEELRDRIEDTDEDNLDKELIEQPQLYLAASDLYVKALDRRDFLKHKLKRLEADLWFKHKKRYERMDTRPTDKTISLEVIRDNDYVEMERELIKGQKEVNRLYGLKDDLQQRSFMLSKMVNLYTSGYWVSDSESGGKKAEGYKHASSQRRMASKRNSRRTKIRRDMG